MTGESKLSLTHLRPSLKGSKPSVECVNTTIVSSWHVVMLKPATLISSVGGDVHCVQWKCVFLMGRHLSPTDACSAATMAPIQHACQISLFLAFSSSRNSAVASNNAKP